MAVVWTESKKTKCGDAADVIGNMNMKIREI